MSARKWVFPDNAQAEIFDVSDIKAYRLGTNSWVVATAHWQFACLAVAPGTVEMGACIWETRILFPARSGDEHAPRIMKANRAVPVENVSAVDWSKLVNWDLPQRVLDIAETEGRKPTLVEMMTSLIMALQPPKQNDELGTNLVSYQHYQQHDESLDEE
ncbi:hypothetical protein [Streptomyces sp. NBC_00134]|uniref:hypothetical protein n=1 Tax=Streptomyces sp. NBC_00134 TaxID=2975663 RepID=UPI00324896C7